MRKIVGLIVFAIVPALFFASQAPQSTPLVKTAAPAVAQSEIPNLLAAVDLADQSEANLPATSSEASVPGTNEPTELSNTVKPLGLTNNLVSPGLSEFPAITSISYYDFNSIQTSTTTGLGTVPNSIVTKTSQKSTTTQGSTTTNGPTTTAQTTTTTAPTTSTTSSGGRTLVWSDEFNSLNTSTWRKEHSTYGDGNNEIQCYKHDNVQVSGGKLKLTAKKETAVCPNSTRSYSSGMVRSQGVTFSPGQSIEYRVKLTPNDDNNQGGLWPAFWSSSWAGGGWPNGGEWDGFEVMTARSPVRSVYSIHYKNTAGYHGKKSKEIYKSNNFSDSWHTMRFDYGHNGVLVWYMDGAIVQTLTNADTIQGWPAPFDQSMKSFKVNLALGGNPGPIDDRALPATYEVDYVRIYDM